MSNILGVDFGTKHLGLAVSDETKLIAQAIMPINAKNARLAQALLTERVKRFNIGHIVYGFPSGLQNKETQISLHVRKFAEDYFNASHIPYSFWNESYTSQQAEARFHGSKKEKSHSEAARIILQEYLDFLASGI